MSDFYEIDFLDVNSKRSGDAITLRYELDGDTYIHVVDGGFQKTGDSVVEHINKYYNKPWLYRPRCRYAFGRRSCGRTECCT